MKNRKSNCKIQKHFTKKTEMNRILLIIAIVAFHSCATTLPGRNFSSIPEEAKIITSDIHNFYKAFDLAVEDTANAKRIFEKHYFSIGSKGLKDFYKSKIQSTEKFSNFVLGFREFYESIRNNVTDITDLEEQILANFNKFKALYSDALFPDIYFLIGRFSSNGTTSKNGLLIGTEILVRSENLNTDKWNKDILNISMLRDHIPITVSHELIHFNQNSMKGGNTLLWKSIREGSAEFIGELISGRTDVDYSDFEGKEIQIWNDFKNDMHKDIWNSWQQPGEDRPRNAGYWIGYMICKAYYKQIGNKEKAIYDILHITNYDEFYKKSKAEEYIIEKYGK